MRTKTIVLAVTFLVTGGIANATADDISSTIFQFANSNFAGSGQSRASFGLVKNELDAIARPEQYNDLSGERSRRLGHKQEGQPIQNQLVWAQIGNIGSSDALAAAYLTKLGPGYLGAKLHYDNDQHVENDTDNFPGFDSFYMEVDTQRNFGGSVNYGWAQSDRVNHGVGLKFSCDEDSFHTNFYDTAGGGFENTDRVDRTIWTARYGVKVKPSDTFSYTIAAKYSDTEYNSLDRFGTLDTAGSPVSANINGDYQLTGNSASIFSRFNFYPNATWDYQALLSYNTGSVDLNNIIVEYQDMAGTITPFNNVTNDQIDIDRIGVSGKVAYHEGPLHVYGGLKVTQWSADINVLGDFDSPATQQYREIRNDETTSYTASVSAVYEFSDKWAFTVGGQYAYDAQDEDSVDQNIDVMTPANSSTQRQMRGWNSNDTGLAASIEYQNSKFLVDIGAGSTTLNGQDAVNFDRLYVSVRLGL